MCAQRVSNMFLNWSTVFDVTTAGGSWLSSKEFRWVCVTARGLASFLWCPLVSRAILVSKNVRGPWVQVESAMEALEDRDHIPAPSMVVQRGKLECPEPSWNCR